MNLFRKKNIFLDSAAGHDNPSAIYDEGIKAKASLSESRGKIAKILNVQARDIIFTSGGTESDNLALLGIFEALKDKISKPHVIISRFEHPAVREAAKEIERRGGEVSIVDALDVVKHLKPNTALVSIIYVNSETGKIYPVAKIARQIKAFRKENGTKWPYLHSDASQAAGLLPLSVERSGVDLLTLDASKVGGPKSTGLLCVKSNVEIKPILFGGGQERGLRPGTENVESIKAFASALERAEKNRERDFKHFTDLKKIFLEEVTKLIPEVVVNSPEDSVPKIVSLTLPQQLHEFLAIKLIERGVLVSTGSACKNLGEEEQEAIRLSFEPETTRKEVLAVARIISEVVI
jgi:cysteine desulfurase